MKKLKLLLLVLLPLFASSQKYIGLNLSMEDKAIGLNYLDVDNHYTIGAESGVYRCQGAKVEHQRYKLGYVGMITNEYSDVILNASVCYNKYNVIYNYDIITRMPKLTLEFGVKTNISDRVMAGFDYDIIHRTGGFSVGVIF